MRNINKEYVVEYLREILPKNPENIIKLENYALENNIPIIHPEVTQFLKVILNIKKPKNILEIGTAIGYSSIFFASNIDYNGKVTTIERSEKMFKIASENIIENNFNKKINILKGDAIDILPTLKEKYDLIFIDAAKSKYNEFLSYCIDNLKSTGLIISDNVLYNGMIANDELVPRRQRTIVRNMRKYLSYISNHPDLITSVIPIGDGLALTYKRSETNE